MTPKNLEPACRLIHQKERFVVVGHVNPDGDCLGSICAMKLGLKQLGKTVLAVVPDGIPELYTYHPGDDETLRELPSNLGEYVAVVDDCENLGRTGALAEKLTECDSILEIDHHPGTDARDADIGVIDPESASTGEIVFALLRECGVRIGPDIAECVMTAVMTDTGAFRFANVKADTLRHAADLVDAGANVTDVAQKVYESRSISTLRLLGMSMSTLTTALDGRVVYAMVTRKMIEESGASVAETEGLVNYVRSVRDVEVAILFREDDDAVTKVSLRSKNGGDISLIARSFGGGGHRMAAGCTLMLPIGEAIETILDDVRRWMES